MRILYNSKDPFFKEPFGTLLPGEVCRIRLQIPTSCKAKSVALTVLSEGGREWARFFMEKEESSKDYDTFLVRFTLAQEGLFFYFFRIETENERFSLYRQGYQDTNMEEGEMWQISCIPKNFHAPSCFVGKVMYQIFPDRFFQMGTPDLSEKLLPFTLHEDTKDIPEFRPDETGEVRNCDFFGGNLRGIEAKLPYLASLGVGVIYLNPIFKAWSNHRYDTADYKKIDEMLGNEKDFSSLCQTAHKLGIKVILDGVFSHTGENSRYFDAKAVFGTGAVSDPDSPYRSWFDFQSYPDTYTSWWGIKTLPCTNEMDEGFLDYIIRSEDSVIARWLRLGADGWRLDVADELPDEFITLIRNRIKQIKPDALLIGEVWEDASNKISYSKRRKYFTAGELDSVMNYPFRNAILDFVTEKDGGEAFRKAVMDLAENYPKTVLHCLMNMLSTHDTPRLLSLLSPTPPPEKKEDRAAFSMKPEDRKVAQARLCCAVFLQFVLPGMPCIYYGDEIGTEGFEDPFCRRFFDWDKVHENPLLEFHRSLAALKNTLPALQKGSVLVQTDRPGFLRIERKYKDQTLVALCTAGTEFSAPNPEKILFSHNLNVLGDTFSLSDYGFVLYEEQASLK